MQPNIYDHDEDGEKGIDLELDMENGMSITIFLSDESARDMIQIIDNKLVARGK